MVLKHYGCNIEQAINGREAINALEKDDFDLILMDVEMPVMNGIEAAKAIRSGKDFTRFCAFNTIPIIGLTGNTDEQSSLELQEAGMNYHLGKPVFKDELVSAIAVMLKNHTYRNKTMNSQNPYVPEQNEAKFWESIAHEKVLDLSTINSLKEIGGEELIASLFETFITDTDKLIDELTDADVRKDMKQYDQILHTLKGFLKPCFLNVVLHQRLLIFRLESHSPTPLCSVLLLFSAAPRVPTMKPLPCCFNFSK